jgi:hypothetical protein
LIEPMLTMRPKLALAHALDDGGAQLKQEPRLVSMTACHCVVVILCMVPSRVMPALFTRTSTGPTSCSTWAMPGLAGVEIGDVELVGGMPVRDVKAFARSSLPP